MSSIQCERTVRADHRPAAAAATTGILVGSAIVATRAVVDQTGPASLAFLRYGIGLVCLAPLLLLSARVRFRGRDLLPIGLLGIGQFGVLIVLLNFGLQRIPSALAGLIFATMPLLTMLLAAAVGHERLRLARSLGVLLSLLGVGLALNDGGLQSGSADQRWLGEAAVFGSSLSGAFCSVLYRPYLRTYPALQVSVVAMLAAVVFLAPLAAGEGLFGPGVFALPHLGAGAWQAIAFIGLSSGIGYFLWLWALRHTTATRVTVFLALSPITAMLLGTAVLGEPISALSMAALGCVALGLWLAHREASEPEPDHP
jgi:drug/metabolite transporter (DMT)-like permease